MSGKSKIERTPDARAVAALILPGPRLYVEGDSDMKFWKNIINSNVHIESCAGWKGVLQTINQVSKEGVSICVGVVDKDYREFIPNKYEDCPENVFVTDEHDLEMMMYKTDAFRKILNNTYSEMNDDTIAILQKESLKIAVLIGYRRLVSQREGWNLEFKKLKKKGDGTSPSTGSFKYPKYENIFTGNKIKLDEKIEIDEPQIDSLIINFSSAHSIKDDLIKACKKEKECKYDPWVLANGHDFTYLLMCLLKKSQPRFLEMDAIEEKLYLAYGDEVIKTNLYKSIVKYCKSKGIEIFKKNNK